MGIIMAGISSIIVKTMKGKVGMAPLQRIRDGVSLINEGVLEFALESPVEREVRVDLVGCSSRY